MGGLPFPGDEDDGETVSVRDGADPDYSTDEVHAVWIAWRDRYNAWKGREKNDPILKFGTERESLIRKVLSKRDADGQLEYSVKDLLLLFRFVWESNTDTARWLRGQKRGSTKDYLQLSNLLVLRDGKLLDRLEEARDWAAGRHDEDQPPPPARHQSDELGDPVRGTGVDLGWQALMPPPRARTSVVSPPSARPLQDAASSLPDGPVRRLLPRSPARPKSRVPMRGGSLED